MVSNPESDMQLNGETGDEQQIDNRGTPVPERHIPSTSKRKFFFSGVSHKKTSSGSGSLPNQGRQIGKHRRSTPKNEKKSLEDDPSHRAVTTLLALGDELKHQEQQWEAINAGAPRFGVGFRSSGFPNIPRKNTRKSVPDAVSRARTLSSPDVAPVPPSLSCRSVQIVTGKTGHEVSDSEPFTEPGAWETPVELTSRREVSSANKKNRYDGESERGAQNTPSREKGSAHSGGQSLTDRRERGYALPSATKQTVQSLNAHSHTSRFLEAAEYSDAGSMVLLQQRGDSEAYSLVGTSPHNPKVETVYPNVAPCQSEIVNFWKETLPTDPTKASTRPAATAELQRQARRITSTLTPFSRRPVTAMTKYSPSELADGSSPWLSDSGVWFPPDQDVHVVGIAGGAYEVDGKLGKGVSNVVPSLPEQHSATVRRNVQSESVRAAASRKILIAYEASYKQKLIEKQSGKDVDLPVFNFPPPKRRVNMQSDPNPRTPNRKENVHTHERLGYRQQQRSQSALSSWPACSRLEPYHLVKQPENHNPLEDTNQPFRISRLYSNGHVERRSPLKQPNSTVRTAVQMYLQRLP